MAGQSGRLTTRLIRRRPSIGPSPQYPSTDQTLERPFPAYASLLSDSLDGGPVHVEIATSHALCIFFVQ